MLGKLEVIVGGCAALAGPLASAWTWRDQTLTKCYDRFVALSGLLWISGEYRQRVTARLSSRQCSSIPLIYQSGCSSELICVRLRNRIPLLRWALDLLPILGIFCRVNRLTSFIEPVAQACPIKDNASSNLAMLLACVEMPCLKHCRQISSWKISPLRLRDRLLRIWLSFIRG